MAKGEKEQFSAKQARKVTPTNEKKGRKTAAAEGQYRKGAGKAEGTKIKQTSAPSGAGARKGERRHSGAKPSGTNVSRGGGSAAKKSSTGASRARGKGARST